MIKVVGIHGAPRSGTSWLGQLFNSNAHVAYRYQPFFSHAFRGRLDENTPDEAVQDFMRDLLTSRDDFLLQQGAGRLGPESPSFQKDVPTHLVYKEVRFHHLLPRVLHALPHAKGVGVVRDPRAMLASWATAPREFDPNWDLNAQWRHAPAKNAGLRENWYGLEKWKELVTLFLELSRELPERFRLVRYEDLLREPRCTLDALFAFVGLDPSAQTMNFIEQSTRTDDGHPYGVFRCRANLRPKQLPAEIDAEVLADLQGTVFEQFLAKPIDSR